MIKALFKDITKSLADIFSDFLVKIENIGKYSPIGGTPITTRSPPSINVGISESLRHRVNQFNVDGSFGAKEEYEGLIDTKIRQLTTSKNQKKVGNGLLSRQTDVEIPRIIMIK